MPWLFAWAFSIPCSLCSSCSLEWLSTSLSMIVGKSQFGMLWCGLLFSWAMESYSAFILKSGMHVSTVLWKSHIFGLCPATFLDLSLRVLEAWTLFPPCHWRLSIIPDLEPAVSSCYWSYLCYLNHSRLYRWLTTPFLGHLKQNCWKFTGVLYT